MIPEFLKKKIDECPVCDGGPMILREYSNLIYCASLNKKVDVVFLTYMCETCDDMVTTTESDTISMRRYDIKVRSEFRKLKIEKYLKN
jgi:hypothetical protein